MTTRFAPLRDLDLLTRSLVTPTPSSSVAMDAVRSDDAVTLQFDLPGVDADTIGLEVQRNLLTLSAERSVQRGEGETVLVAERRQGSVRRQLRLSDSLDLSAIEANYDSGVLTVRIPVAESAGPNRVQISVGSAPSAPAVEASSVSADDAVEPSTN